MQIISTILRRTLAWLTAIDAPVETPSAARDWADLPPHHPASEV